MSATGRESRPVSTVLHLRSESTSLVLVEDPPRDGRRPLPRVVHWGEALDDSGDPVAFVEATALPVAGSAPWVPHRLVPLPSEGWRLRPGLRGSRPDGRAWSPRLEVRELTHEPTAAGGSLHVVAADPDTALTLDVHLVLHPSGVLEVAQSLRNDGIEPYAVHELAATLPLPARATEVLDLTGRWCRERSPQRHPLAMGSWVRESRHGRTGHDATLLLMAGTPGFGFRHGEVWALHHAWSGDSTLWAERSPAGMGQLGAAELLGPGEVLLAPGEVYAAPVTYAAHSGHGLDGLSDSLHDLVRARPGHPTTPRKVILNTWEAVYFDHRLDQLTELADAASRLGVELFVLDDGWFGSRRDDTSGLGDWTVSEDVWPDGLAPLIEHVRGLGMDFGLWVEPEMVNPDSDLYHAHPDWLLQEPGRLPPVWRHQHVLDLANPAAYAHILERLDALLRDHAITYLKWDHNRDLIEAGHDGRAGVRAQTLAVYRLLDELRARHPGVEIETCASGGGRVDLGILERTDRVWASDNIDPLERSAIQLWTQLLLPPELVGAHIPSGASHATGRRHSLSFRSATALFGHLGIEWNVARLSAEEALHLAGVVAAYKELRDLLHSGRVVRLDHPEPSALVHGVVARDRSEAVFAYAQLTSAVAEVPPLTRLAGLDSDRRYRVESLDLAGGPACLEASAPLWMSSGVVLPGSVLMEVGISMPVLRPEQTLVLRLKEVDHLGSVAPR